MARPMPVFPLVGPIIIVFSLMIPFFSASVINARPNLSFIEPPGFINSSLAAMDASMPLERL